MNVARLGSYASGVVLFSRSDGGLADEMLWLLATDPDPDSADASLDRLRAVLPAYRSRASRAPLVANSAAAAAWASWRTESPLELSARDPKQWHKAVRTSQFRKLEPRGAAAGMRVLDVTSRTVSRTNNASAGGGSPSPIASRALAPGPGGAETRLAPRAALVPRHGGQTRRSGRHQAQGLPPPHARPGPFPSASTHGAAAGIARLTSAFMVRRISAGSSGYAPHARREGPPSHRQPGQSGAVTIIAS